MSKPKGYLFRCGTMLGVQFSRVTSDLEKVADTMQTSLSQLFSSGVAVVW